MKLAACSFFTLTVGTVTTNIARAALVTTTCSLDTNCTFFDSFSVSRKLFTLPAAESLAFIRKRGFVNQVVVSDAFLQHCKVILHCHIICQVGELETHGEIYPPLISPAEFYFRLFDKLAALVPTHNFVVVKLFFDH